MWTSFERWWRRCAARTDLLSVRFAIHHCALKKASRLLKICTIPSRLETHMPNASIKPLHMRHDKGASMIEVLVSIVIFSIGLLGAAGLQLASMRTNQYASNASIAVNAAREYSEIVQLTLPSTSMTFAFDSTSAPSAPTSCIGLGVAACTDQQSFLYAQYDWWKRIESSFPGGKVVVCQDSLNRDSSGQLEWACDSGASRWVAKFSWISKETSTTGETFTANTDRPKFAIQLYGRMGLIDSTP